MSLAFAIGLLIGVRASSTDAVIIFVGFVIAMTLLAGLLKVHGRRIVACAIVGVVIGFSVGAWRAVTPTPPYSGPAHAILTLRICDDPMVTSGGSSVLAKWTDADGVTRTTRLSVPAGYTVYRGERVVAEVTIRDDMTQTAYASQVRVIERAHWPDTWRNSARAWIDSRVTRTVTGAEGALGLGLLIGDDSALPRDVHDDIRAAGLSHITAVSGWNVTLVTASVASVFAALGLRARRWLLLQAVAVAGFVWLVGPDPPVLRAGVMALIVLVAHASGRPAHAVSTVALTAAVLVMTSPAVFTMLSFALSVVATGALIICMARAPHWEGWRTLIYLPAATTTVVGIATAPVLAGTTGSLSLVSIPANIAAAPLVTLATAATLAMLFTPDIAGLHLIIDAVAWFLLHCIVSIASLASAVPWGYWRFAPLSASVTAVLYLLILIIGGALLPETRTLWREALFWARQQPRATLAASSGIVITMLLMLIYLRP